MTNTTMILDDQMLMNICRISEKDIMEAPDVLSTLRMAADMIPLQPTRHSGRMEFVSTLLAEGLGLIGSFNPTHLPFGYEGPVVKSFGWLDRDDLELVLKQIVGLTWLDCFAQEVDLIVKQAVSTAINLGLIEYKRYDAWRPGMSTGSGWRDAVSATTYGVMKSKALLGKFAKEEKPPMPFATPVQELPSDSASLPVPSAECYAELDASSSDSGQLHILLTRPGAGRPREAAKIPVEKQQLAILTLGLESARRRFREQFDEASIDRLPEEHKVTLEWSPDSLDKYVKGKPDAKRRAMMRVRQLVKFQDNVGLVADQDESERWLSTVPFRLRVTDEA